MKIPIFHKNMLALFVVIVLLPSMSAKNVTNRSHFSTRPQFQSASPELLTGCRYSKKVAQKTSWGGHFQAVLFGGASTESDDLGTYFMPFGSSSANVSEVLIAGDHTTLHAQHFNILSDHAATPGDGYLVPMRQNQHAEAQNTFKSAISLHPREWSVGLGLYYQHLFNKKSSHPFWLSISTPIIHVERDVRLSEVITNDGGGVAAPIANAQQLFGTMKEALHQSVWQYGKIDDHAHKKTGIGDIEARLGLVLAQTESVIFNLSVGVIIPTSNKQKNHFMFEPQLGNGQHVGLMGNGQFHVVLHEDDDAHWSFSYEAALNLQYLFENTQKRSFDLVNKPWSRYLEMYASEAQAAQFLALGGQAANLRATPGINILTLDAKVTPGVNFTWNNALILNCNSWEFEVGYNLHAREAESVKFKNEWPEFAAIKAANGLGMTNSTRDITASLAFNGAGSPPNFDLAGYNDSLIKQADIDLRSAAHPGYISHTVYGAMGYHWNTWRCPLGVMFGGSCEFPSDNKALSRWTLWLKADISF